MLFLLPLSTSDLRILLTGSLYYIINQCVVFTSSPDFCPMDCALSTLKIFIVSSNKWVFICCFSLVLLLLLLLFVLL